MANTSTSKGVVTWTPGTSNVPGVPGVTVTPKPTTPTPAPTPKPNTGTSTLDQSVMVNKQSPFAITTPTPKTTVVKTGGTGTSTGSKTITSPTTPKTTPVTPKPTGMTTPLAEKTIEQATAGVYDPGEDPYAQSMAYWKARAEEIADPEQIYQNKLRQWQGYMDSLKGVYAQKVDEVRQQGQGRLGTNRASQARGGLLGSDFGAAQTNTINAATEQQVDTVNQELDSKIKLLMGEIDRDASAEYQAKREAIAQGVDKYTEYITMGQERKKEKLSNAAAYLLSNGITDISQINSQDIKTMAKKIGVPESDIGFAFNLEKERRAAEQAKIDRESQFSLSEGQARYDKDGRIIASRAKTYAPGAGSGGGAYGTSGLSTAAQNIIKMLNTNGGTIDDYVKGSSKDAQALRNEVLSGLANQGGITGKSADLFKEAKSVIDDMINNRDWKKFGYSAKIGGQFTAGFGDMQARAATVNAILARDNLGLLKGAMSDKDIAFINSMSNGVPSGVISEKYAKERMNSIKKKIEDKVNLYSPSGTSNTSNTQKNITYDPSGQVEIEIID